MPISINNAEIEDLAREVAELTGQSVTDAIRTALLEKRERVRQLWRGRSLADDLNEIALRCARRPTLSDLGEDEILGYGESAFPRNDERQIREGRPGNFDARSGN